MEKIINFGKRNAFGTGRRVVVTCDLEYTVREKYANGTITPYWEFSVMGSIGEFMSGQCLDTIARIPDMKNDQTFSEIYDLWKRWHNNGIKAGTPKQESAIVDYMRECVKNGTRYDYDEACEFLKARGLYVDDSYIYNGHPYTYGEAWLFEEIPESDRARIRALFGITKADEDAEMERVKARIAKQTSAA